MVIYEVGEETFLKNVEVIRNFDYWSFILNFFRRKKTMKTLNNTCLEVLSALLDKTKTQTMRKAWQTGYLTRYDETLESHRTIPKDSKFKVGDEVIITWDIDNRKDWFFKESGLEVLGKITDTEKSVRLLRHPREGNLPIFNKYLGKAVITEVFKIKAGLHNGQGYIESDDKKVIDDTDNIARKDGFKTIEHLLSWIDDKYNLSTPKEFWVYRWGWKS